MVFYSFGAQPGTAGEGITGVYLFYRYTPLTLQGYWIYIYKSSHLKLDICTIIVFYIKYDCTT